MRGIRRDKLSQRDAGFTLVELIVAMLVIAIVLIAIITVQARALTTNADSQARQSSTAIANQTMEQLRAMPWDYLKKGLYSGFKAAAGGDTAVTGTNLVAGGRTYALKIGSIGSDQDLSKPWPPLFDVSGSNKQVVASPSGNGDTMTVRSYVTADQGGNTNAVGLVVTVSWKKRTTGTTESTILTSTAYAPVGGKCGSTKSAPYLAACQARFEATSSTSKIVVFANAAADDGSSSPLFAGSIFYSAQLTTGSASARVASQQVSNATSVAGLGGMISDDNSDATAPAANGWTKGSTSYSNAASDDTTTGAAPPNPADVSGGGASTAFNIMSGPFNFNASSDETRTAKAIARTTQTCETGLTFDVTAGAPCGSSSVTGSGTAPFMGFTVDGKTLALATVTPSASKTYDRAWAGRFAKVAGKTGLGCTSVTGIDSGCTSAGAQKGVAGVVVGAVSSGTWTGASNYLVSVSDYTDSVLVQRGVSATATAPSMTRAATISYWNGTGYSSFTINTGAASQKTIPAVTWTTALATITASGTVDITDSWQNPVSSTACKGTNGCSISAGNGLILIAMSYRIEPAGSSTFAPWTLTVGTTITGSQAAALFKESPNA